MLQFQACKGSSGELRLAQPAFTLGRERFGQLQTVLGEAQGLFPDDRSNAKALSK